MSPTALRWSALTLGLIAFACRVAGRHWLPPLAVRMGPAGILVGMAAELLALAVPAVIFLMLVLANGYRFRPTRFTAENGRFKIAPNPLKAGMVAILFFYFSGKMIYRSDGESLLVFDWWGSVLSPSLLWAGALAFLLVQRPRLQLDPEGLTLRQLRRTTRVTWDQIVPGHPAPPARKHDWIFLHLRPTTPGGAPGGLQFSARPMHIDPSFLANSIRYYAEHPEARATIGMPQLKASTL